MIAHIAGIILCVLIFATTPAGAAEQPHTLPPYIMGIFPFVPTANIEGIFAPLAAEMSKALDRPVKLKTAPSFEKFMDELKNQAFDFAYIQPFDYVDIAKPAGYLPLASRNDTLSSHIVVKHDSPIKTLKELKGKSLGMPPKVAAISFLNRIALKKAGLNPDTDVTMVFLASHMACLQQMMIGTVDACGISPAGVRLGERQLKTTFHLIQESPKIPTPLFVAHKKLPRKDRDIMLRVLTTTDLTGVKPELRVMFIESEQKAFRKTNDREYDVVRNIMKTYNIR